MRGLAAANRRVVKQRAMRNGQNKRMRGRNRKGQNPLTRVYESNGPDVKIRGTANHVAEKYLQLARDAQSSGDPVAAENYYQHAEHYFRLIAAVQEQFRQNNPYARDDARDGYDDGDDDGSDQPMVNGEPYAQPSREQSHGYQRESQPYQQRESQPYPQQREMRYPPREQHPQPYVQRSGPQPSAESDESDIDRLPAFVTGAAAPAAGSIALGANGANGHDGNGADRFPLHRRRRRRHTPRPGEAAGETAGETGPGSGE